MTAPSDADIAHALRCARNYRAMGYQPLPSKMDVKGPMLNTFADYWESPLPGRTYDEQEWRTTNIQLMTGADPWRLMVVDCDGEEAIMVFDRMVAHFGGMPETWWSRTGGGGRHYYFTLPGWLDECPSRRLWGIWDTWAGTQPGRPMKGDWQKHKEIRILGDNALVIAPPSIHVETGKPYTFAVGPSPALPRPAAAPGWLLAMPEIKKPECVEQFAPIRLPSNGPRSPLGRSYRREEVLAAIPSLIDVARRWGLRTASAGPGPKGWWNCWSIDREESRPSAQFHDTDGTYWCGLEKTAISLFDLGVIAPHGGFASWLECRDALADEFIQGNQTQAGPPARTPPPPRRHPPARV